MCFHCFLHRDLRKLEKVSCRKAYLMYFTILLEFHLRSIEKSCKSLICFLLFRSSIKAKYRRLSKVWSMKNKTGNEKFLFTLQKVWPSLPVGSGLPLPVTENEVWMVTVEGTVKPEIFVIELTGVVLPSDVEGGGGVWNSYMIR